MIPTLSLLVALAFCLAAEGLLSGRGCGSEPVLKGPVEAPESGAGHLEDTADNPGYDAQDFDDMATDWDAAEAVQEVQPFTVPPAVSPATWSGAPALLRPETVTALTRGAASAGNRTRNYPIGMRWHYGAHHKSGTNLLRELALEHARLLEMESCVSRGKYGWTPQGCSRARKAQAKVWFWCNLSLQVLHDVNKDRPGERDYWEDYRAIDPRSTQPKRREPGMFRGVHIIRDPIGMVASGYIYHMRSDDTPLMLLSMRNMSEMDGLAKEAEFVLSKHGPEMVRTYADAPPWVMHVRFESLTRSSEDYDSTVATIFEHMLGSIYTEEERQALIEKTKKHDLRRTHADDKNGHVARLSAREQVKQKVLDIPLPLMRQLKQMRKALGYCDDIRGQDMRVC